MKKLLPLGLIIAAVLSLGLIGCKQNGDEDKLPGTWTSSAELYSSWTPPFDVGTLTANDHTVTYELKQPSALSEEDKPGEGKYNSTSYNLTKEQYYTGFRANVTSNADGGCGFIFCRTVDENSKWSYYYLYINKNGHFYIDQSTKGVWSTVKNWDSSSALLGQKNEVLVYTDKSKNIVVSINNTVVFTIKEPELTHGGVGIICTVGDKDVTNDTHIKAVYEFKEFQY